MIDPTRFRLGLDVPWSAFGIPTGTRIIHVDDERRHCVVTAGPETWCWSDQIIQLGVPADAVPVPDGPIGSRFVGLGERDGKLEFYFEPPLPSDMEPEA